MDVVKELFFGSSVWGMMLTFFGYLLGVWVHKKTGLTILQPILVGGFFIIVVLMINGVSFEAYREQNQFLDYILALTAVVLAVPLYRNLELMKKYAIPIVVGICCGTVATMVTAVLVGKCMGTDPMVLLSMLPKSATNPISIPVSEIIGGLPSLTLAMVVITGTFGAVFGPELLKLMRIKNPIAKGIAMGAMTHAVGTSRAFKEGQLIGAMSSLAMALAGTLTAFLAPMIAHFFF